MKQSDKGPLKGLTAKANAARIALNRGGIAVEMVEVKTSELSGAALDYAVAQVEGIKTHKFRETTYALFGSLAIPLGDAEQGYAPSTCWHCGGPLIAQHAIGFDGVAVPGGAAWRAFSSPEDVTYIGIGDTHLIAACRAIVAAKLGDTVSVPAELLTNG